jgi:hypothetical protein
MASARVLRESSAYLAYCEPPPSRSSRRSRTRRGESMTSRMLFATLLTALSLAGCSSSPDVPRLDLHRPDRTRDRFATPDIRPDKPDLPSVTDSSNDRPRKADLVWTQCSASGYDRLCEFKNTSCCATPGTSSWYWCPPGYDCSHRQFDCFPRDLGISDPPCPTGSYCLSMGGCLCSPANGKPCGGCGTCVAACNPAMCPQPAGG